MNNYWQVTVQLQHESDKGKVQRINEQYIVNAVSATEAEAKIYKDFEGESNFEVIRVAQNLVFEQNTIATRNAFLAAVSSRSVGNSCS